MSRVSIRAERPGDVAAIRQLIERAFRDSPHGDGGEAALVDHLRLDADLTLSLVAEVDGDLAGHVAISPVAISDGSEGWFGIGPVSVLPERQGGGIGSRLMRRAIANMRVGLAHGLVVLGDPGYYSRFEFVHDPRLVYPGAPAELFQRLTLRGENPQGAVRYAPAFET